MAEEEKKEIRWVPLESNPDVMNKYIASLGATTEWGFHDIFGLDADLLMMIPRPVASVMLLYPVTDRSESEPLGTFQDNSNLYFTRQTVRNASCTVGIVHALANNTDRIQLDESKPLAKFLARTRNMNKDAKAVALGEDKGMSSAHQSSALEGQSAPPDINDSTRHHFVAFIHKDGGLYEMNGLKEKPMYHGNTTPDTLLEDTIEVVKKFMARDPTELNFNLTALALNSN